MTDSRFNLPVDRKTFYFVIELVRLQIRLRAFTCICSVITVKDAMSTWKSSIKIRILLLLGAGMLFFTASSVALSGVSVKNKGAAEIKLPGGKRGLVPFPHHLHQDKLGDCDICHSFFPQKAGIIEELKAQGKLKKKQVMNKLCTKCHKQRKKEGIKAGPTTCVKCHIKEKK